VIQFPDPILKVPAVTVAPEESVTELVTRMKYMLTQVQGLGLSAQQAGSTQRVALCTFRGVTRVCINLAIVERSKANVISPREGCLSVIQNGKVFRMNVKRSARVLIRYEDENRVVQRHWVGGLDAIVAQHEAEHLDGRCIIDRLDPGQLAKLLDKPTKKLIAHLEEVGND
jgi:peptide deformylase